MTAKKMARGEAHFFRVMAELSKLTAAAWGLDGSHEQIELGFQGTYEQFKLELEDTPEAVTYPIIDPDNRPAPGELGHAPKARARKVMADGLIKRALRRGHLNKTTLALNNLRCEECDSCTL